MQGKIIRMEGIMTNNNVTQYTEALNAYKTAEKNKPLDGFQIAAKLYGGLLKNMHDAKRAFEKKDLEEVFNINKNTFDIVEALQVRLNHEDEEARETTDFLYRFYNIVFVKTAMILDEDVDTASEYDALINYIKPVYDRWMRLAFPDENLEDSETPNETIGEEVVEAASE